METRICFRTGEPMDVGHVYSADALKEEIYFSESEYVVAQLREDYPTETEGMSDEYVLQWGYAEEIHYYTEWLDGNETA
jgi:hypothetical protein